MEDKKTINANTNNQVHVLEPQDRPPLPKSKPLRAWIRSMHE